MAPMMRDHKVIENSLWYHENQIHDFFLCLQQCGEFDKKIRSVLKSVERFRVTEKGLVAVSFWLLEC